VPSRLLPPWFETEMAVAPTSTARRASSGCVMPLIIQRPSHCSHSIQRRPMWVLPSSSIRRKLGRKSACCHLGR